MTSEEKFWSRVDRASGECWVWTGCRSRLGYGQVRWRGRTRFAHRVAWEIAFGFSPPRRHRGRRRAVIMHRCDNPPCVRPEHLALGTQWENIRGAVERGRMTGAKRPRSKLSVADRDTIRSALAAGATQSSLALRFGVSQPVISWIANGRPPGGTRRPPELRQTRSKTIRPKRKGWNP